MNAPQRIGRYQLLGPLAKGGMGVVYRGVDPGLDRPVAIKLAITASQQQRQRLATELRSLLRLDHPHLVKAYDAGDGPWGPYLVMELIEGESLQARLERDGPLPPREAASLVADLADAVHHAHEQGVLHRDIKPLNVLIDRSGLAKLIDFGLALELDRVTRLSVSGALMGSPGYWSPEQARGERDRVGPAADVYGLGALLYALLTGRPPIQGSSLIEVATLTIESRIPPPSRFVPGLPKSLERTCLKALHRQPTQRQETAFALAGELRGAVTQLERERGSAAARRRTLLLGGAGLLALGLGLGLAVTWGPPPGSTPSSPAAQVTDGRVQLTPSPSSSSSDSLLERARAALAARDWEAALSALDAHLAASPQDVEGLATRARLFQRVGLIHPATADLEAAHRRRPDDLLLRCELATQLFFAQGEPARPEELLESVAARDPEVCGPMFAGLRAYLAGEGRLAEALLRQATRASDPHPHADFFLALTLVRLGRPEDSLPLLQELVTRRPADTQAALVLSQHFLTAGRFAAAEAEIERALSLIRPGSRASRQALDALLDVQTARLRTGQLRELPPRPGPATPLHRAVAAHYARARVLSSRNTPLALEELEQALALAPDCSEALLLRAFLALRGDDLATTERDARRALELNGHNRPEALLLLGRVALESQDPASAVELLTQGIEARPDALAFVYRADALLRLGRYAEALRDARRALPELPGKGLGIRAEVAALSGLGRHQEALSRAQALLERRPTPENFLCRANALFAMGRFREARQDARQVLEAEHVDPDVTRSARNLIADLEAAEAASR